MVAISGIDGSGKTTLANALKAYFCNRGKRAIVVWFRWRAFLQYLLFAYSNLRGLKRRVETIRGVAIERHFFEEDVIALMLYPYLLFFDLLIYYLAHKLALKFKHVDVVIYDRQFADALVDVLSFCQRAKNHVYRWMPSLILRLLLVLAVRVNITVVLDVEPKVVLKRKSDIWENPKELGMKRRLYLIIATYLNAQVINSEHNLRETLEKTLECLKIGRKPLQRPS